MEYYVQLLNGNLVSRGDRVVNLEHDEVKTYASEEEALLDNPEIVQGAISRRLEDNIQQLERSKNNSMYAIKYMEAMRYKDGVIHNEDDFVHLFVEAEDEGITPGEHADQIIENYRDFAAKERWRRMEKRALYKQKMQTE